MFSDAHLHLGDVKDAGYPFSSHPDIVFSCTARPSEWTVNDGYDHPVKRFYGVHPWYADEWNPTVESDLRRVLSEDPSAGVGEIGLDDTRGDMELQVTVFEDQLRIASETCRTVTVHMPGCERQTLESIRRCAGGVPVILHAFKSESYVRPFSELNCYFSVGPRLLAKSADNVRRVVSSISRDRLLVETDAPHMPRGFTCVGDVVSRLAEVTSISPDELAELTANNLRRIQ